MKEYVGKRQQREMVDDYNFENQLSSEGRILKWFRSGNTSFIMS